MNAVFFLSVRYPVVYQSASASFSPVQTSQFFNWLASLSIVYCAALNAWCALHNHFHPLTASACTSKSSKFERLATTSHSGSNQCPVGKQLILHQTSSQIYPFCQSARFNFVFQKSDKILTVQFPLLFIGLNKDQLYLININFSCG